MHNVGSVPLDIALIGVHMRPLNVTLALQMINNTDVYVLHCIIPAVCFTVPCFFKILDIVYGVKGLSLFVLYHNTASCMFQVHKISIFRILVYCKITSGNIKNYKQFSGRYTVGLQITIIWFIEQCADIFLFLDQLINHL